MRRGARTRRTRAVRRPHGARGARAVRCRGDAGRRTGAAAASAHAPAGCARRGIRRGRGGRRVRRAAAHRGAAVGASDRGPRLPLQHDRTLCRRRRARVRRQGRCSTVALRADAERAVRRTVRGATEREERRRRGARRNRRRRQPAEPVDAAVRRRRPAHLQRRDHRLGRVRRAARPHRRDHAGRRERRGRNARTHAARAQRYRRLRAPRRIERGRRARGRQPRRARHHRARCVQRGGTREGARAGAAAGTELAFDRRPALRALGRAHRGVHLTRYLRRRARCVRALRRRASDRLARRIRSETGDLMMRTLRSLLALAVFATAIHPAAAAPKRTLLFGAAVALSGSLSNEGQLTREGYDFWMRYVNAHGGIRAGTQTYDVEIRYADDQSKPETTARLIESMITDEHVDFVLGPYGSAPTFAAAAVAERHAVPMVDSGGSAERIFNQGYRYTVGVQSPARKYLVGIIEYAVKRKPAPKTIAIAAANDAFSLEVQQGAVQSANDHGLRVVYADRYADDPSSVAAAAAAIKAAHPDVVLSAGHLKDALQLHRALKEQHVAAKIYGYSVGPDTPEFRVALGPDAQAVVGSARAYAASFARGVGHAPDYHNAEASAAGLAFQYAIERAGTIDRTAVRNALARLDVVTFFGLLKFDERGVNVFKPMVVNQIQGAKLLTIYPYRLSDASPVYPAPAWVY